MPRNKVYAIVEGHGEVDAPDPATLPAVYQLIHLLLHDQGCNTLFTSRRIPPWRMRSCGDFDVPGKLENTIRAHIKFEDCVAVLVLRDLDDGCAARIGPRTADRIRAIGDLPFSVIVVCAVREYEAWFLASLETIHPGHLYPGDPEGIRAAKGWLTREFGYREVRDQSTYTSRISVEHILLNGRSRSFHRLYHGFEQLIAAAQAGQTIISP
jgi:hypothetical protein